MRGKKRNSIEKSRKKLPQFTTMNVMDGQAGLVNYTSLIFYSLTIDNILNIIVLIILAGVSIAMLVGENGIITQAQRADELTTQAQQKEAIELAIASVQAQGTLELDKTKLETALQSQLGDTTYTLTENGDGSFLLQIAERSYYIDSTGEVIAEENMSFLQIDNKEAL